MVVSCRYGDPVLVSGSNRSGTTWVGRMLCASGELEYLHEPFNPDIWPRPLGVQLGGHYTYVNERNEGRFLEPMRRVLEYRPRYLKQLVEASGPRDVARLGRAMRSSALARVRGRRPLLKDPIAIFAAPWHASRFHARVIFMIRHPAAYVSSIARLGWNYDFSYMLRQPALMDELLYPWREEIEAHANRVASPFDQAITLWRIFYGVAWRWQREHPDWLFIRYEDLAEDPESGFEMLYGALGLRWDHRARRVISSFCNSTNPKDRAVSQARNIRRNSRAAARVWTGRLSPTEVLRVREGVKDVAELFYGPGDWPD